MANYTANNEEKYQIVCPYCFNEAAGGKPFSHKEVHFRAETYYANPGAIEQALGTSKIDIEMMSNAKERGKAMARYEAAERFLLREDPVYNKFWKDYDGTTEREGRMDGDVKPWNLPVISAGNGVQRLTTDEDGFVVAAMDDFGKPTYRRVCPYCHNPLPMGFGKHRVKNISIIGITGAGKTVYISQLLKGMTDYAAKSGLGAFFTSDHESNFIQDNRVAKGVPLPIGTLPNRLSQPMFYDIVQTRGSKVKEDTIVLYDIAGENCRKAGDMVRFARFIEHSDGLILLIDPKQLNFVVNDNADEDVDAPSLALNTLHAVLEKAENKKCTIPIAVCVSKSDQCFDILPAMAQDHVQMAGQDETGMPSQEFDGRSYNQLSRELTDLMKRNAMSVCTILQGNYLNFNFFAVSATGCECVQNETGRSIPVMKPEPRRIEEPILWLFKQFGYIQSNENVYRPFPVKQPDKEIWKKGFMGLGGHWERVAGELASFEEDMIRDGVIRIGGK